MKIQIPDVKDILVLTKPWTFRVYHESRNASLLRHIGHDFVWQREERSPLEYTMPSGTELIVDRIYIRNGAKEYSSVTFRTGSKPSIRFWAKLKDVNTMHADLKLGKNVSLVWKYVLRNNSTLGLYSREETAPIREDDIRIVPCRLGNVVVSECRITSNYTFNHSKKRSGILRKTYWDHYYNRKDTFELLVNGEVIKTAGTPATIKKANREYFKNL